MRNIKFRAKEIDGRDWIYGGGVQNIKDKTIMLSLENDMLVIYEVDPETVGQFTGLQDKNGVDIYEGDIITDSEMSFIIKFGKYDDSIIDDECFGWFMESVEDDVYMPMQFVMYFDKSQAKIIGNIHDK